MMEMVLDFSLPSSIEATSLCVFSSILWRSLRDEGANSTSTHFLQSIITLDTEVPAIEFLQASILGLASAWLCDIRQVIQ